MRKQGSIRSSIAFLCRLAGIAGLALGAASPAGAAARALAPPDVLRVTPAAAPAGRTTTLTLAVKDFSSPRCTLDFGEGTAVLPPVTMPITNSVVLSLQVAATAPAGRHDIWISCLGLPRQKATAFLTLTPGAPARVQLPDVLAVSPASLKRGSSATLTLQVSGFNAPTHNVTTLDFGPGIKGTRFPDVQPPAWKVDVAPGAPVGRHPITISYLWREDGRTRTRVATAALFVEGDPPPAPAPIVIHAPSGDTGPATLPVVPALPAPPGAARRAGSEALALNPGVWQAGSTYEVTLTGRHFAGGMQVRFGEGVSIDGAVQVTSPTLARLTVRVAEDAAPGERRLELSAGVGQPFASTAVRAQVRAALHYRAQAPAASYPDAADFSFQEGKIILIAPEAHAEEGPAFDQGWLNNATIFRWEEDNPGVSDTFELRLLAGDQLLMSRWVASPGQDAEYGPVPPLFYRPDTAFLDEIFNRYFDVTVGGTVVGHPQSVEWQVAGYLTSTTYESGPPSESAAGGKSKPVKTTKRREVAVSERRLLRIPYNKHGLACGVSGYPEGSRTNQYVVLSNEAGGSPNYVDDLFELSGEINLSYLPIEGKELEIGDSGGDGSGGVVVRLTNLFVDWGDRSGVSFVFAERRAGGNYLLLPRSHRYQEPGAYVTRLFMLTSDDIQAGDPSALAEAADKTADQEPSPWESPDSYGGSSAAQVASRAVQLFCQTNLVIARKDLVALGPLQLLSIEITGSNGQGATAAKEIGVREDLIAAGPPRPGGSAAVDLDPSASVRQDLIDSGPPPTGLAASGTAARDPVAARTDLAFPGEPTAAFGECDSLQNAALLKFYGCGIARVTWHLEDAATHERIEIGSEITTKLQSTPRKNLADAPEIGTRQSLSQVIRMRPELVGRRFAVSVSARVVENCEDAAAPGGKNPKQSAQEQVPMNHPDTEAAAGELSPYREGASRLTGVAYSQLLAPTGTGYLARADGTTPGIQHLGAPYFVESEPFRYRVAPSTPGYPCRFSFTTANGAFEVDTLREIVQEGGRYRGRGSLHLAFPMEQGKSELLVDVAFADWRAPDGYAVLEGTIDKPHLVSGEFGAHGLLVKLERLHGGAGADQHLNLDLAARVPDGVFALSAPGWQATAPLTAAGDWFARAGKLGPLPIGYSANALETPQVAIDLSAAENGGDLALDCRQGQDPGTGWMGLHLGAAKLSPDTFSLFPGYTHTVQDWAVVADGVCGRASMGGGFGRKNFKSGELGFDAIELRVRQGFVTASYEGFYARVPPLFDAEFSGTAVFTDGPGQTPFVNWDKVTGPAEVAHTLSTPSGRITARSINFGFRSFPGVGWGVRSDTAFSFEANHQPFAGEVWVNGLVNDFDGILSREGGGASADVALGAGTVLGETPITLDAVHIGGFGTERLAFDFAAKVRISTKLSETPLPVGFTLERKSYSYAMRGPLTTPFVQEILYNEGTDKQVATKVTLNFMQGDAAGDGQPHDTQIGNCAADDLFCGSTEGMSFMGVSVNAQFRLGMKQGEDYFALRADVDGINITLPPCFALYGVGGGLAHNFKLTDMLQASLLDLEPDMGGAYVFMARLKAGLASDPNLLSFEAKLLISTTEQPMMTFKAWILSPEQSKSGDVWGFFTAGAGGIDGGLAGDKSLLGNLLRVEMPGDLGCYAQESVVDVVKCAQGSWSSLIHFGGATDWYMYMGQNVEGKLIKATLAGVFNTESYVTLKGIGGLAFGAKSVIGQELSAGKFRAGFSVGAKFDGAVMWPTPLGVKADGKGWAEVYGCYKKTCFRPGETIWFAMEFSDVRLALAAGYSISIGCPFPISSVGFGFALLPCCNLDVDVNWCDYGL